MSGKLGKKVVTFGAFIGWPLIVGRKASANERRFGRSQAAFSNTATLGFVPLRAEIYEEFSKIFGMAWGCADYGRAGARTTR
jgi:hypothetical protein